MSSPPTGRQAGIRLRQLADGGEDETKSLRCFIITQTFLDVKSQTTVSLNKLGKTPYDKFENNSDDWLNQ